MKNWDNKKEVQKVIDLRAAGTTPPEIADVLNEKFWDREYVRTGTGVTRFLERKHWSIEKCQGIIVRKEEPVFVDKKRAESIDWREWFDTLEQRQELHQRTSSSQDEATIKIDTDKKIAVCFSADWHTGSVSADYTELRENLELILGADRVYMMTVGDLINNFRKFYSLQPILSQLVSPKEQITVLESILHEFLEKKKWLAACWGNHDIERDEKLYGESTVKNLLSKYLVYFNGKGNVNLVVGDQTYRIRMAHKFMGSSMHNPNHPQGRELRQFAPDADVIVSAHLHHPATQNIHLYGRPKCLIQTGTYDLDEGWSKRWFTRGAIGVPTVVFYPDKHYCFVYPGLRELLEEF